MIRKNKGLTVKTLIFVKKNIKKSYDFIRFGLTICINGSE